MLSSIHPLGEQGRGFVFRHTAVAFVVGSTLGGLATGSVVGLLGVALARLVAAANLAMTNETRIVLIGGTALIGVILELRGGSLPSLRRQVNEDWLNEYRNWVYGIGFGFQLGGGVWTFVTSAAVMVWLMALLLAPSLKVAVLIGVAFGLTRGLTILSVRQVRSSQELMRFHQNLHRSSPTVQRLGAASLAGLGVIAGVAGIVNGGL